MTKQIDDKVNELPDAGAKGEGETSELLPCPFCGGEATLIYDQSSDYKNHWSYIVECTAWRKDNPCGGDFNYKSKAEAVTAWNRRSDAALTAAHEECERLKKTNKAANFCEAHIPDPELPYLICPICLTGQLSDSMDKCEQLRKENEALKYHIDFRGENEDSPWSDEARQAVYEIEEKFDIEVVSIGHHAKFFDEIERLSAEVAGLRAQLTAALAERDAARNAALEEAAKYLEGAVDNYPVDIFAEVKVTDAQSATVLRRMLPNFASLIRALIGEKGENAK